jgi:RNA polymerase sigma factor (sigma-70 family)
MSESAAGSPSRRTGRRAVSRYLEEARRIHEELKEGERTSTREVSRADPRRSDSVEDLPEQIKRLVEPHLFYVVQVAGEFYSKDIPFEDLLAEGNIGLVEAAHRFDPQHKVKFLTYASWWIRKRILDFLAREGQPVHLTRYAREQRRDLRFFQETLRRSLGREPTPEELATASGLTVRKVREHASAHLRVCSLDQVLHPNSTLTIGETLTDPNAPSPEDYAGRDSARRLMLREVARLPERERTIIANRFGFDGRSPMTFQELGEMLGVSRERARQIEREALDRLRRRLQVQHNRKRRRRRARVAR